MKTAEVVLLLLWSGQCVTAASSEALQTTGTGKGSPPQQDIQTVLREMSSLIAEQTVELKCTKTQLETVEKKAEAMEGRLRASEIKAEVMESRLRASEIKAEATEGRLRASEKTVEELTHTNSELTHTKTQLEAVESRLRASEIKAEATESRLRASENLVDQLKIENKAQAMGLNLTVADVSDLKKEREQSRVSFSASLVKEGGGRNFGPTAVDAPLVFRNDFTNIGNAYSANTGVFTAPTRGVYFFVVFVLGQGGSTTTGVWLFKNDKRFALAWSRQQDGFTKPSNGASVVMEKGDEVYVKLVSSSWVHDNQNNNCVFSGHLLFPM
ncbi:multimerin-2-like isoform X1 [Engraulis encrasicolus]|uniref:multimerin-2-like isoform X1 n=1 Tax=Engraulis encrasicolus TaxID=184585 RepID=UPI002FD23C31